MSCGNVVCSFGQAQYLVHGDCYVILTVMMSFEKEMYSGFSTSLQMVFNLLAHIWLGR